MSTIPTPQELVSAEAPIVQRHIELLAARLRETKRYYDGSYIIDKPNVPSEHWATIVAEFGKRGWVAKFVDDQRDGMSFVLTPA